MKKKAIKYTIIFLVIPLILSLSIALATGNQRHNDDNSGYDGLHIPDYSVTTKKKEIKKSNEFMYFSLFTLIAISGGAIIYIKHKRGI